MRTIQVQYNTESTLNQYKDGEEWKKVPRPKCQNKNCKKGRKLQRHGTYLRKHPVSFPVLRFRCPECGKTVSCLPSFAACRTPGLLQDIEDHLVSAAGARSWYVAAGRNLLVGRLVSNYARSLSMWHENVVLFLVKVVQLRPDLFLNCPAEIVAMRRHWGTETLLIDLRELMRKHLQSLPPPVGLRPPNQCGNSSRSPPHTT